MRLSDLLSMSVNNLWRRKLRTFLTVLGVVIGTASIVVMVSLGIGLNELTMEQIAASGSLTEISVYSNARWGGSESSEANHMTDDVVEKFRRMDHVTSASPVLESSVLMKQGRYESSVSLMGVTREYMENITLKEGRLPNTGSGVLEMVVGNLVAAQFYDTKSRSAMSFGGREEIPDIDFMNRPLFVIFDKEAYYQSLGGNTTSAGKPVKAPKKYLLPTVGLVIGGIEEYNSYSYGVYVDIDTLKSQLKKVFKKRPIPGQPTTKKGKAYNYFIYEQAVVEVDEMEYVTEVQKQIADMGFRADSNMEWLEQSRKQSDMVQAVLGGIGAVSLFVAAIGIANTMMMSIYERTKEIGIIKVLGCDMSNIRNMFLLESGFIGFLGGSVGITLSYLISFGMNKLLAGSEFLGGMSGDLSRIPTWLALSAVGFAIFVGMAAGFFPALRAMKLSPLAAIRNE